MRIAVLILLSLRLHAADCPVLPLEPNVSVDGALSTSDCKAQDILPAASLAAVPDLGSLTTQVYSLTVPEPDGVLTVAVTSTAFPPFVAIVNDKKEILGLQVGSTTTAASLLTSLKAGKYTVLAGSRNDNAGNYTIQPTLEARRDCNGVDYKLGDPANGELTAPDCRILDIVVPSLTQRRADVYKLTLGGYTVVGAQMGSNAFFPILMVVDAKTGAIVNDGSNTNANNSLVAELYIGLPAGEYLLLASSSTVSGGTYAMRTVSEPGRTCTEDSIQLPGAVRGALTNSDCRLIDYIPFNGNFSFIRPYKLEVPRRALITIDQTSTQFDSYLNLLRENKAFIAEDDDGGGNGNSRIVLLLNPGNYLILANSYNEGDTGAFDLRTAIADPPNCPIADLNPGDTVSSSLVTTDCRIHDMILEQPSAFGAKQYRITLTETQTLQFDLTASNFTVGLALFDEQSRSLELNTVQPQATVAQGRATLLPGTYTLLVYASDFRVGTFTLKTSVQP